MSGAKSPTLIRPELFYPSALTGGTWYQTGGRLTVFVAQKKSREARRGALPAGVALDEVTERPAGGADAGAGVAVDGARAAAVVALDGPDGDERQPVGAGEPGDLPGVTQGGHLGLLRVVIDAGQQCDALQRPQPRLAQPRVQPSELAVRAV